MPQREPTALVQLKVRLRESLRAQLEEAATRRGVSINAEIVDRLEHSADRQGLLPQVLTLAYGPRLAGILMMLGLVVTDVGDLSSRRPSERDWIDDPRLDLGLLAAVHVLLAVRTDAAVVEETRATAAEILLTALMDQIGNEASEFHYTSPLADIDTIRKLVGPTIAARLKEHAARPKKKRLPRDDGTVVSLMQWLRDDLQKRKSTKVQSGKERSEKEYKG